jgi:hypothetical protein
LNPDVVFVFGDNTKRIGKGGQAIIRDYPNALGSRPSGSATWLAVLFFKKATPTTARSSRTDLAKLEAVLKEGKKVVIPVSRQTMTISLGLERAQLQHRAPELVCVDCDTVERFASVEYGSWDIGKPA